jgi:hypothetical protein
MEPVQEHGARSGLSAVGWWRTRGGRSWVDKWGGEAEGVVGASLALCTCAVGSGSVVVSDTDKTCFVLAVELLSVAVSKS